MGGIWVNEHEYLDFTAAGQSAGLTSEVASRQTAWDFYEALALLPDPDPVLRKLDDGGAAALESLTADGHLCSVIQSRKLGTLKKEFRWTPGAAGTEKPTAAAAKLCDFLRADLENIDMYGLIAGVLDAPLYGMAPIELYWRPDGGRMRLADLVIKPCRWFGFDPANQPRFISADNPWAGETIPFGKFVFARHFPTYDNPYGMRLLSRCFWPVTFKKGGLRFWVTLAEKYGMPFLLGKYRQGATAAEQRQMLNSLSAMVADAVAVIPSGGSVEILDSGKSKGGGDIHQGLKQAMDAEVSKVIMGQTLTAETSAYSGSRSQGQVHEQILADFREADQHLVATAMNEIARIYARINAPDTPAPVFGWYEQDDPNAATAERDKTLRDTGVRFTKTYYMKAYNLKEDDFEVSDPESPGSQGGRFAEAGEFTPEQQQIEDTAAAAVEATAASLAANEEKILAAITEADSYEAATTRLLELYPDLDTEAMSDLMGRLWFNAELYGRATAGQQAEGDE